jgi:hypothetical protein
MKFIKRYIYFLLLFFAVGGVVFNSGCSSKSNPTGPVWTNDSVYANIVYDDSTKVFNQNDLSNLMSIDTANQIYYFSPNSSKAASLQAGDNVVIGNYSYFKVTSVTNEGSDIAVQGEFAPFTDVVKDADISWDYGIIFDKDKFMQAIKKTKGATIQTVTGDSIGFGFKFPPFEYSIGISFSSTQVNITIIAEKIVADTKVARLVVTGVLNKFKTTGKIKIRNHVLQDFNANNNYQEGEFELKVTAAGSGNDIGIEVPLPLLKFPIAGIPFVWFEIKCLVVMNAVLPADASTFLDYKFKYNADFGLQYDPGTQSCNNTVNLRSNDFQEMDKPHSASASAMEMSWGIAVPRFEVNVGVPEFFNTTVGWIQAAYLVGGDYTFYPACQEAKADFLGAYGWSLGAFGMSVASGTGNLWKQEKVFLKAGNCK